jgi:hypothetical protein
VSPLRDPDPAGPPALIVTSRLDPFAGQVRMPHAFTNLAGLFPDEAHAAYDLVAAAIRRVSP